MSVCKTCQCMPRMTKRTFSEMITIPEEREILSAPVKDIDSWDLDDSDDDDHYDDVAMEDAWGTDDDENDGDENVPPFDFPMLPIKFMEPGEQLFGLVIL